MSRVAVAARSCWSSWLTAWRSRTGWEGLLATTMLLVGALTPAYLPANSPWWPRLSRVGMSGVTWQVIGSALAITGVIVLVDAWLRLRPGRRASTVDARAKHWAVLAVWILPLLAAPPIFSHDAYSYAAQGWLMENDINPYEGYPGLLPGVFADQVAQEWRFTRTPYGPLSLQLQHDIVRLAGFHPYWSAVMMRIPALVGVVLIGVFLPRLARRTGHDASFAAWFGALNPLLVVDFVGGAHNDSFMMGLMVFGLWLATTASWAWVPAAVVIGASAAVKQPAVMAAVALPFIVHPMPSWRPRHVATALGRVVGSLVGAAGSFALITWRTGLGFGWYHAADVPGRVMTVSPSTLIGLAIRSVLTWFGRYGAATSVVGVTHTIGVGIGAVILVWLAVRKLPRRPLAFLAWGFFAVALTGPALHSWYVLWGALLLPLVAGASRYLHGAVWVTVGLLAYDAINLSWRNGVIALGVAAAVFLAAYLTWYTRRNGSWHPGCHNHGHHQQHEGETS